MFSFIKNKLISNEERAVEEERLELQNILEKNDRQLENLKSLAKKVGASEIKLYPGYGDASVPEIIQNIHQALQTKSMIAAVKTSSNHLIISIILSLIAFGSMIAAFIAVFS